MKGDIFFLEPNYKFLNLSLVGESDFPIKGKKMKTFYMINFETGFSHNWFTDKKSRANGELVSSDQISVPSAASHIKNGYLKEIDWSTHFPLQGKLLDWDKMTDHELKLIGKIPRDKICTHEKVPIRKITKAWNAEMVRREQKPFVSFDDKIRFIKYIDQDVCQLKTVGGRTLYVNPKSHALMVGDILTWTEPGDCVHWNLTEFLKWASTPT